MATRFLMAIFLASPILLSGCAGTPISKMDSEQLKQYRAQAGLHSSEYYDTQALRRIDRAVWEVQK